MNNMTSISKLIDDYSDGAELLGNALRTKEIYDVDRRPIQGRWSVREVVCHLADSEIVYADRMKRILAEDNPTFFEADPTLFAPALYCQQRPLVTELNVIDAVRAHMLPILRSLDPTDFQRTGRHSLDGSMTLQTLLQRITSHIPHHIVFIDEKLKAMIH